MTFYDKSGGSEPPVDKEPRVPEAKNRAQNPSTGGSGDTGGFFHTEGGAWDSETLSRSKFSCYHCDYYHTDIEADYLTHGATKHVNKPMFPGKVDIEKLGLKP